MTPAYAFVVTPGCSAVKRLCSPLFIYFAPGATRLQPLKAPHFLGLSHCSIAEAIAMPRHRTDTLLWALMRKQIP